MYLSCSVALRNAENVSRSPGTRRLRDKSRFPFKLLGLEKIKVEKANHKYLYLKIARRYIK